MDRCILVSVHEQTTNRIGVHLHIQGLHNQRPTARALLRCVSRFNPSDHTTRILSFVRGVLGQLTPGSIRDALGQTMILKHVLDPQILKSDKAKAVHQFAAFLMRKVSTPVGARAFFAGGQGCVLNPTTKLQRLHQ